MADFNNFDDIVNVSDITDRVEELEGLFYGDGENETLGDDVEKKELETLRELLEELKGQGEDEQWRGDWYPQALIRDSHFQDYAQEFAEDCGMVQPDAKWPNNCIDWDQAARELQHDYSQCEFDGITFYFR